MVGSEGRLLNILTFSGFSRESFNLPRSECVWRRVRRAAKTFFLANKQTVSLGLPVVCHADFEEVGIFTCKNSLFFTKSFYKRIPHCSACCSFPKCSNYANDSAHHMGLAMWLKLSGPSGSPWTHPQRQHCCVCDVFRPNVTLALTVVAFFLENIFNKAPENMTFLLVICLQRM